MSWRGLRIVVLLGVLACVALGAWLDRVYTTDWRAPLGVAVHPIAADTSAVARDFVANLGDGDFAAIETFFRTQSRTFGIEVDAPVRIWLGEPPDSPPPLLEPGASLLAAMAYSLRLRWHAWRTLSSQPGPTPHIRMYLLYHDPARSPQLPHSLGLERGLVGVVHLFADRTMRGSNDVVLAHEILHTLGASDKYDPATLQPRHPDGFADPQLEPLYPQARAELMGGRIPRSPSEATIPESLAQVVIGPFTAQEIRWRRP